MFADHWEAIRRIATPKRILIGGWLLFLVYSYPGYLSPDPVVQLNQARADIYGDWHPPAMGWLWKHLDYIIADTILMLVAQSVTFLIGLYLLLRHMIAPQRAAVTAVLVLLFPAVLTTMAVIWKDSQMAGYLMLGIALLLSRRRGVRLVGCALLSVATMMRYNALAATLPVVVMLFEWRPGMRRLGRYAIAFAMWVAITFIASRFNKTLTDREEHTWYMTAFHDITGIIHWAPEMGDARLEELLPGILRSQRDHEGAIDHLYYPSTAYGLVFSDEGVFKWPATESEREIVRDAWLTLIREYPVAYFKHRFKVSKEILGYTRNGVIGPVWDGYLPDSDSARWDGLDITMHHSAWQSFWVRSLQDIGQTMVFRAYLYFFVAIALLWFARRSRLDLALLLSGLMYEGTFFIAAVPDARYSHWMISCTVIVYIRLIVARYREGRAKVGARAAA